MHTIWRVARIGATIAALAATGGLLLSPSAGAVDKVLLGGGAGIALGGKLCTLATIGNDAAGELVGFTDSHCGGPGAQVVVEGAEDHGMLGTVVAADEDLHYAVIRFDAAKVAPIPDFDGFTINGVGPPPGFRQLVCQQSRATGHSCNQFFPVPNRSDVAQLVACRDLDDLGAPVAVNDLLIGMIIDGKPLPPRPCPELRPSNLDPRFFTAPPVLVLIGAIIGDINSKGGPGAGFAPILG
jgi:hypothetical protein